MKLCLKFKKQEPNLQEIDRNNLAQPKVQPKVHPEDEIYDDDHIINVYRECC